MTARKRTFSIVIAACALLAIVAGFAARAPIERAIFVRRAEQAFGASVSVTAADYAGGAWDVRGLSVRSADANVRLDAPRARVVASGDDLRVGLDTPEIVVNDPGVAFAGANELAKTYPEASIRVHAGHAMLGGLALENIDGTFRIPARFDGTLALRDGGTSYPISARSSDTRGGGPQRIVAAALPLALLGALREPGDMRPVGGMLRDLDFEISTSLRGRARLDDAAFALGAHRLHGLHGDLVFRGGGAGSKVIAGFLDAVPFDAVGEVHDLPMPYGWLTDGSRDLRAFGTLIGEIAGERGLRSVHVDTTAPGVGFALYTMQGDHGPLAVNVLTIDPTQPTLRFDTAIAEDHVVSGGERTSAMGVRTGAVAGVNGDYFDIGRTYQPQGMLERAGEIVRGPVQRAALVIDRGNHVRFDVFRIAGRVRASGRTFPVTQLNDWPVGEVTVITPAFGKTLPAAPGVEFAALAPDGAPHRYRVTDVTQANAPQPVRFGVAFGPVTHASLHAGETVELSYGLDPAVGDAVAAIGGGPILVRNGAWYEDPFAPAPDERNYRWPVIALARQADDHLLLVAVDGRHPERSVGMTRPEFADLLIRFGAVDAMALDSGGSVTMVSRAPGDSTVTVRNAPSDHSAERWISDGLFVYSSAPPPTIVPPAALATPVPETRPAP